MTFKPPLHKPREAELAIAVDAARAAAKVLSTTFFVDREVVSSAGRDVKSRADIAAESEILKVLGQTHIPILSEEDNSSKLLTADQRKWIVDPLDGTFNFTRGFPIFCVSVSLWNGMSPEVGVIYDFAKDQLYAGTVGGGATCNGQSIVVSQCSTRSEAVLSTGFPTDRDYSSGALATFVEHIQQYKKIRMIGSAAMSLACVASGAFDAYIEEDIWLWDVAAGLALVQAAGGTYALTRPSKTWKLNVFAHNGNLAGQKLHEILEKHRNS